MGVDGCQMGMCALMSAQQVWKCVRGTHPWHPSRPVVRDRRWSFVESGEDKRRRDMDSEDRARRAGGRRLLTRSRIPEDTRHLRFTRDLRGGIGYRLAPVQKIKVEATQMPPVQVPPNHQDLPQ